MHIGEFKRTHIRVRSDTYPGSYDYHGRRLRTCAWHENAPHTGVIVFDHPTSYNAILRKGRGKDDWYADYDNSEVFEGPHPLDVLITILTLNGFSEVY